MQYMKKFIRFVFNVFGLLFSFGGLLLILGGAAGFGLFFIGIALLFFWKARSYKKQLRAAAVETEAAVPVPAPAPAPVANPAPVADPPADENGQPVKVRKYKVTGVTHYIDNILNVAMENPDYEMTKRELIADDRTDEKIWQYLFFPSEVQLMPEPGNEYDPNAIKVIVDGEHVGYIKSGSASHLLKLMESGGVMGIDCKMGGGKFKRLYEEYDDEKDEDVFVLEKDDINYFVHLEITERA